MISKPSRAGALIAALALLLPLSHAQKLTTHSLTVHPLTVTIFDGLGHPWQSRPVELTIQNEKTKAMQTIVYQGESLTIDVQSLTTNTGKISRYGVIARVPGFKTAACKHVDNSCTLMLAPVHASLDTDEAHWRNLAQDNPQLLSRLICSSDAPQTCPSTYETLLKQHPERVAALLNIAVALQQINVGGRSAFSYYQAIGLDHTLFRDRFFAYVDRSLYLQLQKAAAGQDDNVQDAHFTRLKMFFILHRHATSSFKETDLNNANLQLTFEDKERMVINGIDCVRVETDIDYYRHFFSHGFEEVLPNLITHRRTSPLKVFRLRFLATKKKQEEGDRIDDFRPGVGLTQKSK